MVSGVRLSDGHAAWEDQDVVIHLVRHACAGKKGEWTGPDAERPLDPAGERQADALRRTLHGTPVTALLASPTRRCLQTLEPLADRLDRDVEASEHLRADVAAADLLRYLVDPALDGAVLCTHGEVMGALLPLLRASGTAIQPPGTPDEELLVKGTAWRLDIDPADGEVLRLQHLRPSPEAECQHHRARSATTT